VARQGRLEDDGGRRGAARPHLSARHSAHAEVEDAADARRWRARGRRPAVARRGMVEDAARALAAAVPRALALARVFALAAVRTRPASGRPRLWPALRLRPGPRRFNAAHRVFVIMLLLGRGLSLEIIHPP
jgi:hypothetical protein